MAGEQKNRIRVGPAAKRVSESEENQEQFSALGIYERTRSWVLQRNQCGQADHASWEDRDAARK